MVELREIIDEFSDIVSQILRQMIDDCVLPSMSTISNESENSNRKE